MSSPVTRTIVQLVLIDETGDSYYRMRWPGMQLAEQCRDWRVINLDAQAKERFQWGLEADLLVLIQSGDTDLLALIEQRRARGKKTLIEYNDQYYEPPAWSPVATPWSSPLIWQSYELIMNAGDGLTVTGPGLEALFRPLTTVPITQLLNHFPRSLPPFEVIAQPPAESPTTGDFRIGWAGSLGHMADILSVQPVFAQLFEEFPRLTISLMGNESMPEALHLPSDKIEFTPWGSMESYLRFWGPIQVGIAPLLDTPYNRCRSDIKALEITATGTLPVLQNALPYGDFIRQTEVPSYDSHRELIEILRSLISNPDRVRSSLARAYRYVRTERVGKDRTERQALYRSLMENTAPSTFIWPLPAGYHEHAGTKDSEPPSTRILLGIQKLLNARDLDGAETELRSLAAVNPKHPDIQLALFKLLLRLKPTVARSNYPALIELFPRDLRFTSALLASERDPSDWKMHLAALCSRLLQLPPRAREVFRKEIFAIVKAALLRDLVDANSIGTLVACYPGSPELQLVCAEQLERAGKPAEAAAIYELLGEMYKQAESFDEIRKGVASGFFNAWANGLKGRLS